MSGDLREPAEAGRDALKQEMLDALGMDPLRDWDDVVNAARCIRAERDAANATITRVREDLVAAFHNSGASDKKWLDGIEAHVKRAIVMLGRALDASGGAG